MLGTSTAEYLLTAADDDDGTPRFEALLYHRLSFHRIELDFLVYGPITITC